MFVFGKFDMLSFLETPALRFALLPYYQCNVAAQAKEMKKKLVDLQNWTRINNFSGLMDFWKKSWDGKEKEKWKILYVANLGSEIIHYHCVGS